MEWQNFLNLCICQESQLQHVEDYRRVSLWLGTRVVAASQGGGLGQHRIQGPLQRQNRGVEPATP